MTPPKKTEPKVGSQLSSTRVAKPSLVPAGKFKRGGNKAKLQSDDGLTPPIAPELQARLPGSAGGQQSGGDVSPVGSGGDEPQQSRETDRQGSTFVHSGGLEPVRTTTSPRSTSTAEPPHSQSTPRATSAPGVRETEGTASASRTGGAGPTWLEQEDEAEHELQAVGFRRGVQGGQDTTRELPVDRTVQGQKPGELEPLTLKTVTGILQRMFSEIEKVVDGNAKQVMVHTDSFRSALSKYMQKDLTTPMANNFHL
ncbi:hypothetical protein PTTG_05232, partial [Puccinia triticina 1-1 BBBD Race 1]